VKVIVNVSPDAVADAIGGVELAGGCGKGQSCEAVPVSLQPTGDGGEALGVVPPQADRSARARTGARRFNLKFNGGEG
jgi:hypothetical protein